MSKLAKALTAAAGNAGESLYVEDVFSTYLYTGNGSTQTITNGIDLDGEGGMVWLKSRSSAVDHVLIDNERGVSKVLYSNSTSAELTTSWSTSFNSDGFNFTTASGYVNASGGDYASWTFRKAEKFFDVVTYTGTGSTTTVSHNLGSTPGFFIIKRTDSAEDWTCWHTGVPGTANYIQLNKTDAYASNSSVFNNTAPTDTVFTVGSSGRTNASGGSYVAYLFAHDAGGFGDDGSESIIKCGSYTGTAGGVEVNLGFEPQWVMVKPSSIIGNWDMADVMRGATAEKTATFDGRWAELTANTTAAEIARDATITPRPTGMFIKDNGLSNLGDTYIYIAIRRPMKTPESGTEVFAVDAYTGTGGSKTLTTNFVVDAGLSADRGNGEDRRLASRLTGSKFLKTNNTETEGSSTYGFDSNESYTIPWNISGRSYVDYAFKRATGFFDVVAYTGDGTTPRDINHNLVAVPEFIVTKRRDVAGNWAVYHPDLGITSSSGIRLNTNDGWGYSQLTRYPSTPTSSVYTVGNDSDVNSSGNTFVSYLWTTLAGVSKVGSYTGTGADLNVDCGFSAGARFVIIKRYGTSTTGDWYVWDSERGIVAGNDPYLLLNSTAAEVTSTDYIDPLASGFTVTSSAPAALNASGGTYIFLAIA